MKILIVSKSFPDEGACTLREYGHDVNCARDVKAAQRVVNDGYIPDLIYLDSKLDSAQFFAKQARASLKDAEIYLALKNIETSGEDPSRLGIDGFIGGDLGVDQIIERAGDMRPPAPQGPLPEEQRATMETVKTYYAADKNSYVKEQAEDESRVISIKLPRLFHAKDTREIRQVGEEVSEENKAGTSKYRKLYRLAFPAILGIFAIAAIISVYAPRVSSEKPAPQLQDLRGKSIEEADEYLAGLGVHCEVVEVRSEDGAGNVMDQDPPAGTALSDTEKVTLMLSVKKDFDDSDKGQDEDALANKGGDGYASPPSSPALNSQAPGNAPDVPQADEQYSAPAPETAPAPGSRPVVSASASQRSGPSSGVMVTLSASAYDPDGGSIVSYSWSCGGSGPAVTHEFTSNVAPSTVTVTVTVTDDEGQTASASVSITLI